MGGLRSKLILFSAAHAAVDFACAVLFFGFLRFGETGWIAMVLYNAFAFAFQLPIGLLADRFGHGPVFASAGCALVAAAFLFTKAPLLAAVIAGLGNGAFHVGGGVEVMDRSGDRAGPLGVFVSPGAIGLFLGKFFSDRAFLYWAAPVLSLVFCGLITAVFLTDKGRAEGGNELSFKVPMRGAFALTLLFLVVVLRSYLGFTPAFSAGDSLGSLDPLLAGLVPVICLALGKAAGGYAADLIGARLTAVLSLGACALLLFFPLKPVFALIALFLFNMSMPLTLHAAKQLLPGLRGAAFGLLTFALFIGVIPAFLGVETPVSPVLFGSLAAVSGVLLFFGIGRSRA